MSPLAAKAGALLACAALLAWALAALQDVLLPVLLALLLAYLLDPPVAFLERRGLSRTRAAALVYVLVLGALLLAGVLLVPWFVAQSRGLLLKLHDLADRLPAAAAAGVTWMEGRLGTDLGLAKDAAALSEETRAWVLGNQGALLRLSGGILGAGWSGVSGLLVVLLNLVLVPLYGWFFLLGLHRLPGSLRDLLPEGWRDRGMRVLEQVHGSMAAFFRGRLLVCAGKGVVAAAGMALGGVPFGILVGLASGVMGLVPFLAFPAGALLGSSLALLDGQGLGGVLWVLGALGAAEAFEAVANPWILGRELALHPAVVLFALLAGGKLLGVMGLLLSVPLASACKILWRELLFPWWREVAARDAGGGP